jgi:ADP-ribose pyrophosphatase
MAKFRLLSSEVRMDDGFLRVTFDRAIDPEGHELGRAIIHHEGSAVIFPINDKGQVLLERIFRLPAGRYLWELPAGRMDPGETPLQAAKRELAEETGLKAKRWKKLASFYASPGFLAEKMTIYQAEDLTQGPIEHPEEERMKLRWFTVAEYEKAIESGRICDAKTIIGFRTWTAKIRTAKPKQRRGG